jgi:hypothetical protein
VGEWGKWAYLLVEYDLVNEPLHAMRGQVVADFIVDHLVNDSEETYLIETSALDFYFLMGQYAAEVMHNSVSWGCDCRTFS